MELLKTLYGIYSPSGKEKKMRGFIRQYSQGIKGAEYHSDKSGNVYITKGLPTNGTYPCVVAHLDQVQDIHSSDFQAIESGGVIFGFSAKKMQLEGLGADDKNGIWIALKALEKFDSIKVAFFVGEEIGCVGSSNCDMSFFDDVRFVIEPDRRGANDLITSISGLRLCSDEFVTAIKPELFGYKPTNGLMTDVLALRENGLEVSCINLSCGYYKPHTDEEMTIIRDIENCKDFVFSIIGNLEARKYDAPETYRFSSGDWYGYYDSVIPDSKELQDLWDDDVYDACMCIAENMQWENPDDIWDNVREYFESHGILRYEFIQMLTDAFFVYWEEWPWWANNELDCAQPAFR